MTRWRIKIDTTSDAIKIANIAGKLEFANDKIVIKDGEGMCVNAKSVLGALHAMEFSEIWLESERDIYAPFAEFILS